MSTKPPAPAQSAPLLKNAATAPLIYFDNAPVRGSFNGNIEVELSSRYLMPKPDGTVVAEMVCVAHLRCTPQSAQMLIESLQNAIEINKMQTELMPEPGNDYAPARQTN